MSSLKKTISLIEATALIICGTVGAGILGIPYVISHIGIPLGLPYIFLVGIISILFNLLLGDVAIRTGKPLQIVGLAKEYLGPGVGWLLTFLTYPMLVGILTVYIIGVGESLQAVFGGAHFFWSLMFFAVGALAVGLGLKTIKVIELFVTLALICVVIVLSGISVPHLEFANFAHANFSDVLLPYGVLLFAYHGVGAVPEAYRTLQNAKRQFKPAIIFAGVFCMILYAVFSLLVVGVTGQATTEIATIGLGQKLGPSLVFFGNIFAAVIMGSCFLMTGLALRDSLEWDFKLPRVAAILLATGLPLILYILGLNNFIKLINFIGGVLISLEMLFILAIVRRAYKVRERRPSFIIHHSTAIIFILVLAFSLGTVYSFVRAFGQ